MAAMRSAVVMLGRRSCGSSGSAAAASTGGGGLGIHQALRPVAPPLRPGAVEELLQNWRRFSTGVREPADNTWWQWARDRVKNADPVVKSRALCVYGVVVIGAPILYLMNMTRKWV